MYKKAISPILLLAGIAMFTGCFDPNPSGPDTTLSSERLFIAESDFQSGQLGWMGLESTAIFSGKLSIWNDAVLRTFDGYLYVIEKFGADNIIRFDPSRSDQSGVKYQQHLGDNLNPVDIEFIDDSKAYISCQLEPIILVFNPSKGSVLDTINISAYTFNKESNSTPYANQMALAGDKLYVSLQRRDGYNPGTRSLILVINTETDEIEDTIPTQYKNCYDLIYNDGTLYVTNPGNPEQTGDGAIEAIDVETKQVRTVISEDVLGGSPYLMVHKSGTMFYVQNYISWGNVSVVEIDASSGTVGATLPVKDAYGGLCYDDIYGRLYVGERSIDETGIRIFENNVQIGKTIKSSNSLPPYDLTIIR